MVSGTNVTTAWPEYSALPMLKSGNNASTISPDHFLAAKQIVNGVIIPLLYFSIFVVGIFANSIVLYASSIFKMTSKSAIDIYVGNLAIADLSLIMTLPFWAVTHVQQNLWSFGNAMCKIASALTHINMYASVFLITAMAIDRHTVVVKGIKVRTKSLRSASRTWFKCVAIWCLSVILSIPSALFRMETTWQNLTFCSWKYPVNQTEVWWAVHMVERNVIGFLIPLVIICRCYIVLISYVRSRGKDTMSVQGSESRNNQVHRITKMVTTIILAFTICWLPNQTSNFMQNLIHYKVIPSPKGTPMAKVYYMLHLFFTSLSFCNSVINPIIYSTSPSHRTRIKQLLTQTLCCEKLHYLLFQRDKRLKPNHKCQDGSPESCHGNRRTLVTRLGHPTVGSPYAARLSSQISFHSGNGQTSIKRFDESCIDAVESEEASLLQSPINPDAGTDEEPSGVIETSQISVSNRENRHGFDESVL